MEIMNTVIPMNFHFPNFHYFRRTYHSLIKRREMKTQRGHNSTSASKSNVISSTSYSWRNAHTRFILFHITKNRDEIQSSTEHSIKPETDHTCSPTTY